MKRLWAMGLVMFLTAGCASPVVSTGFIPAHANPDEPAVKNCYNTRGYTCEGKSMFNDWRQQFWFPPTWAPDPVPARFVGQ